MKALNDLRQCDVFDNSILKKLQNLSPVNLNVVLSEESFCVIVTQDCDIVHEKMEEEPFLEFMKNHAGMEKILENFILKMQDKSLNLLYITDFL